MKPPLVILLFFSLISCKDAAIFHAENSNFEISRDTSFVSINGVLSKALLINNKYYCFYEERDSLSTKNIKHFYILSQKGRIEREVEVPSAIDDEVYYSLLYRNGSIVTTGYMSKEKFVLDTVENRFIRTINFNDVLFEDDNYKVESVCDGEFGSTTYFTNKKDSKIYETGGCPFIVNYKSQKYFITSGNEVREIADPKKMKATLKKVSIITDHPNSMKGTKLLFRDADFFPDSYIATSFVADAELYHVFINQQKNDSLSDNFFSSKERIEASTDTVKIGLFKNNKLIPSYVFDDSFDITLQQQYSSNHQFCTFHTERRFTVGFKADKPPYREKKYGFIEITGKKIKIHYFVSV